MDSRFFSSNRQNILSSLDGGLLVITAYTKLQDTGDAAHAFRQEPNFWYLSGIEYADWLLIADGTEGTSWLVAPAIDDVHQLFDGSIGHEEAKKISGVDGVLDQEEGRELLQNLAKRHKTVYTIGVPPFAEYADFALNPAPGELRKRLKKLFSTVEDCQQELARIRAIKQLEEIAAIKKAARISITALEDAKAKLEQRTYEYEIEAELTYVFRRHGATHAFEPIVAAGKNACTLHYASNHDKLHAGSLLLIDTGARLGYYSADITRTFAVGVPTKRQQAIHTAVQSVLERIAALLKPGMSVKEYANAADSIMQDALLSLGLMKGKNDLASYRTYFPHAVSHGLGLDVHESLGGHTTLQPGMVLTVEPGIYIPEEGIGVRIEDDILITERGNSNLTAGIATGL